MKRFLETLGRLAFRSLSPRAHRLLHRWRKTPLDVLFFSTCRVDEQWLRSTIEECRSRGLQVASVLSTTSADYSTGEYFDASISPLLTRWIRTRLAVTASTGMPRYLLPRPKKTLVHMPHSFISLHMGYPPGAFDSFDVLFACNRHQCKEWQRMNELTGKVRPSWPIGYGKMDLLLKQQEQRPACATDSKAPEVLLAPSWGKDNILERMGIALVSALRQAGFSVVVRPHPSFFYFGNSLLKILEKEFADADRIQIEDSRLPSRAMWCASLMISDYSGTAMEFALLRRRPVVFVDVAPKVLNPGWRALGLRPAELALRDQIGTVVAPDVVRVVEACKEIQSGITLWEARIRTAADELLFNPNGCARAAADQIVAMLRKDSSDRKN